MVPTPPFCPANCTISTLLVLWDLKFNGYLFHTACLIEQSATLGCATATRSSSASTIPGWLGELLWATRRRHAVQLDSRACLCPALHQQHPILSGMLLAPWFLTGLWH